MSEGKRRNSNRLHGYDYSLPGAYFVTLVVHDREPLFGHSVEDRVEQNTAGEMAGEELIRTADMRKDVKLDEWVVMPDHLHVVFFINEIQSSRRKPLREDVEAHGRAPLHRKPRTLGSMITAYKAASTRRINELRRTPGQKLWQRNYFDRIIRDQLELERIREYVHFNPLLLSQRRFFEEM